MTHSSTLARIFLSLLAGAVLTGYVGSAFAGPPAAVPRVNAADNVGVKGYDPVAYFTADEPTPGLDRYSYQWKGVTYRFATAANLATFKADPEKYLPRYGGYCAYAMSLNRIADIDPKSWAVVDGKLYLNNGFFAHSLWSLNKTGNIKSGDRNWAVFPKTSQTTDNQ